MVPLMWPIIKSFLLKGLCVVIKHDFPLINQYTLSVLIDLWEIMHVHPDVPSV